MSAPLFDLIGHWIRIPSLPMLVHEIDGIDLSGHLRSTNYADQRYQFQGYVVGCEVDVVDASALGDDWRENLFIVNARLTVLQDDRVWAQQTYTELRLTDHRDWELLPAFSAPVPYEGEAQDG